MNTVLCTKPARSGQLSGSLQLSTRGTGRISHQYFMKLSLMCFKLTAGLKLITQSHELRCVPVQPFAVIHCQRIAARS
jgi:hypothetical protein